MLKIGVADFFFLNKTSLLLLNHLVVSFKQYLWCFLQLKRLFLHQLFINASYIFYSSLRPCDVVVRLRVPVLDVRTYLVSCDFTIAQLNINSQELYRISTRLKLYVCAKENFLKTIFVQQKLWQNRLEKSIFKFWSKNVLI